jgi:membrane protein
VLVLLWIYYSSQILLLGAEFTEVYSRRYGSRPGERPKLPQH